MSIPKNELLSAALSRDLMPPGSRVKVKVVDDSARKVFTANKDGAVLVFGYKQADGAYWNGVKHYGSGLSGRIRIRRTQSESAKSPSATTKVKAESANRVKSPVKAVL